MGHFSRCDIGLEDSDNGVSLLATRVHEEGPCNFQRMVCDLRDLRKILGKPRPTAANPGEPLYVP